MPTEPRIPTYLKSPFPTLIGLILPGFNTSLDKIEIPCATGCASAGTSAEVVPGYTCTTKREMQFKHFRQKVAKRRRSKGKLDYFEAVVVEYLRADRSLFVNTQCCIQLHEAENPDTSGPHWYCDAVVVDFRARAILLGEITYSMKLTGLIKRLTEWNSNWPGVRAAVARDCHLPEDWPIRPWLFLPEQLIKKLVVKLDELRTGGTTTDPMPIPLITNLEMTLPWKYRSWNRVGENLTGKSLHIPEQMRT